MHELSLAAGIVDLVSDAARAHDASRVVRVRLAVGALAQVEPEALALGFEAASRGTVAEGASLVIERPPGTARCLGCGATPTVAQRGDPCPDCGGFELSITGGEDLRVIDLEVE
jgi:hydrogenase nickel incorporation protein HypA/HybF